MWLKYPFWPRAAKLESVGTKIFLLEVDLESCEWNDPLTCDLKKGPNSAKSNRIFPGKWRGYRAMILTYLDSLMADIFPLYCQYISITAIFRGKRWTKAGSKVQILCPSLFHKNSNPLKNFQTMFLFARVLPLVIVSTKLDHIWGSKGPKTQHYFASSWECKPKTSLNLKFSVLA